MAAPHTVEADADNGQRRRDGRAGRHAARTTLWRESTLDRVRECGACGVLPSGSAMVKATDTGAARRAGWSGVATCGSTWACPVCSYKIAAARSEEIAGALRQADKRGWHVEMVTVTMRHHKGQALSDLWDGLSYAWSKATSGSGWNADVEAFGIKGWYRVVEVTHGENGWHVHVHSLVFTHDGHQLPEGLGARMFQRWAKALVRKGFDAPLAKHGGLDQRPYVPGTAGEMGDYFTKVVYDDRDEKARKAAWEVTAGTSKTAKGDNATPFQILARVVNWGDAADLALWHEWEKGSHRRRQTAWSKDLREQLVTEHERTDEEIAQADDLKGDDLVLLPAASYRRVVNMGATAKVLDLAEADDTGDLLRAWLDEQGIPWEQPPPRSVVTKGRAA